MTLAPAPELPPARPNRRWLRLSLRGLMVLVLVIGGVAGWVANTIRTQRQAIAAVRAAGGTVQFDYQQDQVGVNHRSRPVYRKEPAAPAILRRWLGDELFQHVTRVYFREPVPPAALAAVGRFGRLENLTLVATGVGDGFRQLRGLGQLASVWVAGPGITDGMLGDLAAIPSIRSLTIGRPLNPRMAAATDVTSPTTDAGFARLTALAQLESLDIEYCPDLTDAGAARLVAGLPPLRTLGLEGGPKSLARTLAEVARHHPNLESLHLDRTGLADDDLKAVEGLTKLRFLEMQGTKITDAGVAHLRPLRDLRTLLINSTAITDASLSVLGDLTALEQLHLNKTGVTDAGIVHLAGLSHLRELSIGLNTITDAAMPAVARLTSLERLTLSYSTGISDAGLVPLRSLTKLTQLGVVDTKVTPAGVAGLQQAVPTLTRVTTRAARPAPAPPAAK